MLENYFGIDYTDEQKKRILAVQAALEVIIASAGSTGAYTTNKKVQYDTEHASQQVGNLADAIQAALEK
ncbi:TPA: hypothetical protein U5E25_002103 [Yersinia enterocolitica]|uniref:hypothetical protein n=1 Tax=Yersinia TaxID=629 RepID=UPI0011A8EE2D|nr:hypothetical protein [Yersinia bercovieri]EKN3568588.1 hypothetical protein [Yersinia enterocolitica]EKN6268105.1 hypothetical protein [Yersinia enterocolitica]HDL6687769.1 hypothetical protein [Yersinia enterocolitica]HEN3545377.1 hypothetical protein [Yersinia enterocolitica]HEN3600658.1 hypothetical protein [Yersinia enterocolitica]